MNARYAAFYNARFLARFMRLGIVLMLARELL